MKRNAILIFAAGAIAGWHAKRALSEGEPWEQSYGSLSDDWQPPATQTSPAAEPPSEPVPIARDPFRAAFQGAKAEIDSHIRQEEEPDENVA